LIARRIFIAGALLIAVSGCAGGPGAGGGVHALPPIEPGKGRVFIYRNSTLGSTYTPDVLLNGAWVGRPRGRGVYFRDVPPGSYAVTTSMTSVVAHFSVGAGERKYVRLSTGYFESHMHPELVDPARGEAEISGLEVLGQPGK
jgi:hypothetical protein